jgi:glucose-6-phosphate 1-dehydrogenase
VYGLEPEDWNSSALTVVVVGASGDLARKKIFPALFALYHEGMLPKVRAALSWARSRILQLGTSSTILTSWYMPKAQGCLPADTATIVLNGMPTSTLRCEVP